MALFYLCPRRFWKALLALILGGTSKSRVFRALLYEYIHGVITTIKNYLLSLYRVRVCKALPYISHHSWASVVREPDSVACEQQMCRPVCASASLMRAFVICSLEGIIAKQLNLAH